MGRIFVVDLEGRTYNCKFCKTQLALADEVVSKVLPVWPAYRNLPPLPGFETGKWQCEQAHTEEFGDESYCLVLWSKDLDFKMP